MRTESIINILDNIFNKKNSFSKEELGEIDTLVINRMSITGEILSVDFNDLLNFPNLTSLTIDGCMIDNSTIDVLFQLQKLDTLLLLNCDVIEDIPSFSILNIINLVLTNTNFDFQFLGTNYRYLKLSDMDFKKLNCHCDELDVFSCNVLNVDDLFESDFDEIVVSEEQYLTNQMRFDDSLKKITVMEDNGQFILKRIDN